MTGGEMLFSVRRALAVALFTLVSGAAAQNYPARPIRMIVPSSPGGPVDIVARTVGQGYSEALGQQLVIDNRSGAGGAIGAELVARGAPDGYTLLLSHSGPLAIEPLLHSQPTYNSLKDFTPVSLVAATPYLLLVNSALPAKSVKDLIALARAQPGKLNFASGGPGTGIHMAAELLNFVAGTRITHVPYKGASPGMTALMAGEVNMMFNGLPAALPHVKSGKLRAVAVGSAKRTPLLPDLPTIAESGLKFEASGWYGLVGPQGMPKPLVGRLHSDLVRTLQQKEMTERLAGLGIEGIGSTPEAFTSYLREEIDKWGKVIKAAGVKAN
jgi:tripartite-type tricarboxylate transporter receptor subunit TctC